MRYFIVKRVQRLTPQHIEQKQLPVTLHIFVDGAKEPIRLTKISLQSTVAHILYQLLELTPFDYDQSNIEITFTEKNIYVMMMFYVILSMFIIVLILSNNCNLYWYKNRLMH